MKLHPIKTLQMWADLSPEAFKIYETIYIFRKRSIRSLSEVSGVDEETVRKALEELRNLGLISEPQAKVGKEKK
jgi:predicted transcriptional regulator